MKTAVLIKILQRLDPDGTTECCVGNCDIDYVGKEPAYYDGLLQIVKRGPGHDREPYDPDNNYPQDGIPVSGRRTAKGSKIVIEGDGISSLWRDEDFVVEYEDEAQRQRYERHDLESRRRRLQVEIDVDRDAFADWVFIQIQSTRSVPLALVEKIKEAARKFYDDNKYSPENPVTKCATGKSYRDSRNEFWQSNIDVGWDKFSIINITKKN